MSEFPERIICLTEETTEALYLMAEDWRIVGISGFTVRPAQARREKPKVCTFLEAKIDKIQALQPDLILGFSDLQADMARDLVKLGFEVHVFNQRDVAGILRMIRMLGGMIGCAQKAERLLAQLQERLDRARHFAAGLTQRPRVFFEEWDDPLISSIGWVSELIEIAGGTLCFPELGAGSLAKDRIIADPNEVIQRAPDIILGSWCGKPFRPKQVMARPGWSDIPAVVNGHVYEIKSALILQPGPAALTDGLDAIVAAITRWQKSR
ncbi:MAG: cobalamin-binding protein [Acidobacteria bacterium]|nr:cobalamin-binding protein [Acidobacteriota bacterium]MCB9397894.1 cobalamin-binding protein [Acidobacteriota bacterium]